MDQLLEHCTDTAAWLSPYTAALGAHCRTPFWHHPAFLQCCPCDVAAAAMPLNLTSIFVGHCIAAACMIHDRVGWAMAGRGSPAELWRRPARPRLPGTPVPDAAGQAAADRSSLGMDGAAAALLPGGVLAHAHGAEVMPDEEVSRCKTLLASRV